MKRIAIAICMFLAVLLCACAPKLAPAEEVPVPSEMEPQKVEEPVVDPDAEAFTAAQALLDAGEYEAAIEAFSSIGLYSQISDKISEAEQKLNEQNCGFLFGTWKDLNSELDAVYTFTFEPNGVVTYSDGGSGTYAFEDNQVIVQFSTRSVYTVEMINGMTHLTNDNYDMVLASDYEELCPVEVEITMDNWETYFEMVPFYEEIQDAFGDVCDISFGQNLVLREEFRNRLLPRIRYYDNVVFKLACVTEEYLITGDFPSGEYQISENPIDVRPHDPIQVELWDYRHAEGSLWDGQVLATISDWGRWTDGYGNEGIQTYGDLEVIDVIGSLTFSRE